MLDLVGFDNVLFEQSMLEKEASQRHKKDEDYFYREFEDMQECAFQCQLPRT